jgi:hypothetical protein
MSARVLRRSFATPFVLTLAAVPACVVSSPPPSSPQTTSSGSEHDEPGHANPPPPQPEWQSGSSTPPPVAAPPAYDPNQSPPRTNPPGPQAPPTAVANPPRPQEPAKPGVNNHVKGTANTSSTTVAQTEPPPVSDKPSAPKSRGYREWTVTKASGACKSMVKVNCPEGAMCNPPPPAKYECPKFMADNDKIAVIQRTEKAECYVDHGDFTCPEPKAGIAVSCNPPRPQKVTCPK